MINEIPLSLIFSSAINLSVFVVVWFLVRPTILPRKQWWISYDIAQVGPFKSHRKAEKYLRKYGFKEFNCYIFSKPEGWKP